jgi:hypothetical protein
MGVQINQTRKQDPALSIYCGDTNTCINTQVLDDSPFHHNVDNFSAVETHISQRPFRNLMHRPINEVRVFIFHR